MTSWLYFGRPAGGEVAERAAPARAVEVGMDLMRGKGVDYELTEHARESLRKRPSIRMEWIEWVLRTPERVEADRIDPELQHCLGRIPEYDGRVLRVIVKRNTTPLRIITFYFDRKMRKQL